MKNFKALDISVCIQLTKAIISDILISREFEVSSYSHNTREAREFNRLCDLVDSCTLREINR